MAKREPGIEIVKAPTRNGADLTLTFDKTKTMSSQKGRNVGILIVVIDVVVCEGHVFRKLIVYCENENEKMDPPTSSGLAHLQQVKVRI